MKTSALILAITALYSSGVLADHQEPLDASAYVCIRNNKVMGEDGCYKRNGVDRITHCHNAGNGHYHYSECRTICCVVASRSGEEFIDVTRHCSGVGGVLTSYNDLPGNKFYHCPPVNTCVPDNTGAPCP
ncbi:unnamed protein product [Zymoseptoria tritici ST99CH_3D7]|uniref:Cyanovirin-N domain-containing protein n=1 Tax=Zymoseptoria tritici (strain ST99CH_3D7) TaxID=1276538 RepID=A0A1X7SAC8_ZYMT9|nr:unnamed protein product [Zymoseptoria tritici ST99CH_3D7]